jgi:hypothetical protein
MLFVIDSSSVPALEWNFESEAESGWHCSWDGSSRALVAAAAENGGGDAAAVGHARPDLSDVAARG